MAVVLTEKTGPLFDNVLPGVRKRGGKLKMEEKKKTFWRTIHVALLVLPRRI